MNTFIYQLMLRSLMQRLRFAAHSRERTSPRAPTRGGNPAQHPSLKWAFLDACFRRHDTGISGTKRA